jgi:N utilization substance protein A
MKLGKQEIQLINAFDAVVNVNARDCYVDGNTVTFLVNEQDLGQAIGKQGANVRRMRQRIGKNVEIIPYASEAPTFLKKALAVYKIDVQEIKEKEEAGKNSLTVKLDAENREKVLRNMNRLKRLKAIIKKNFEIENVKLV